MRSRRRRDRMKDDPVVDYNDAKSVMDEAIMSYESGETVTTGEMFPLAPGKPKTKAAPAPTKTPTIKRGTFNNDDVRALQSSLKDISAFMGDTSMDPGAIDADFGGNTETAVEAFQNRYGLEVTGVADSDTLGEIRRIQADLAMGKNPVGEDPSVMREDILAAQAAGRADALEQMRKAAPSGEMETDLFAPPSDDRMKTSGTGLRGMSMADMRKTPIIERLLQLSKDDQAAVADLLKSDTGK